MQTGVRISAIGHGVLIALAIFGLPWFGPRERPPIRVTDVSFVSEAEFEAAQSAGFPHVFNVATGFEGPMDAEGHRGTVSGWKADGLPWKQR